jgi:hypothetical protein
MQSAKTAYTKTAGFILNTGDGTEAFMESNNVKNKVIRRKRAAAQDSVLIRSKQQLQNKYCTLNLGK